MIFTEKKITINNNRCKIDSPVVLYRGDYNVEVRFTIVSCPYKYSNKQETNVIEQTEASYGQLVIQTPNTTPIFSEVTATKEGAITFTITAEMIDEIAELGEYTFQIRLFDEEKESRATIAEVVNGIEIREPIAIEDISTTNEVDVATVGYAIVTTGTEDLVIFDDSGNYVPTEWDTGHKITAKKLNKIEQGITGVNDKTEILPVKNEYVIFEDAVPRLMENTATYDTGGGANNTYIFDNLQNADMIVRAARFNLIISFNDGTEDITKNITVDVDEQTGFSEYEGDYFIDLNYNTDMNLIEATITKDIETDDGWETIPCTITKATFVCSTYSNLLKNNVIQDIEYKKITNVAAELQYLTDGRNETLRSKEYYDLYDNSFVWDMNKINERLDENSGVTQNTFATTYSGKVIKVNQKDSEGIGFGQLVPITRNKNIAIFVRAEKDVIIKVYNPNTKELIFTMEDIYINSFRYAKYSIPFHKVSDIDNIFIAFTIKDIPTDSFSNNSIYDLMVIDESTFLKKKEILTKTNTEEYHPLEDYNPATKKYVDDAIGNIQTSGGNNINDTTASATTTYSGNKIENIKEDLSSQIKDITNKTEMLPIKNTHYIMRDCVPVSQQNLNINWMKAEGYIFNDEQITTPDDLVLENFKDKYSAISFHSAGLLNAVISYNDGTNDITKEIELTTGDDPGFYYRENYENSSFVIVFGFDYNINKFGIYAYYWSKDMESPAFYEVKKVTISYNYYTNLIHDKYIADINYSKINDVPYQLNYLINGETKTLSAKEHAKLFDNLFIWDANKINDQLDSTSGVKQNVYNNNKIQIKQKDGEGIGFGQYIPSPTTNEYKLFVSAGKDVIIKVYNRKRKILIAEFSDFINGKHKEVSISDSYSDTDGIFIAFTVKDSTKNFYANTYVSDLILYKPNSFLTKQEVNEKVDKSQLSFNSNGELVVTIDGISKTFVPKTE